MKNQSFTKIAALSGIGSAVLYIVSIIGLQAYIAVSLDDIEQFVQNMADNHQMMLLYGWPGLIATILILPLIYTFYQSNRSTVNLSKMILIATLSGLLLIIIAYLFHLALTYFYGPIFQSLDGQDQTSFGIVFRATIGLQDMFWLGGDLLAFLGIGLLLLLGLKEGKFPKWFLILGALSGLMAAAGSISFIPAFKHVPGLGLVFIAGFSLFAIWEILAGVYLLRSTRT